MHFVDQITSLLSLASLFVLAPAIGRALAERYADHRAHSDPVHQIIAGIGTMGAIAIMAFVYGVIWHMRPYSVLLFGWI